MRRLTGAVRRLGARYGLAVVATGLVVAATANALRYPSGSRPIAVALSAITAGAVLLRGRSQWAMTLTVAAGFAALAAVGIGETPMWAFVELLLVAFWTTEGLPRRRAWPAVGVLYVAATAFDLRSGESGVAGSLVSPLVIVGAPALAGMLLRRSRDQAAQLRELTAELAEQRDRAAVAAELAERARIAREIHDVVAHTVSVMLVQAGAAQDRLDPDHPAAAAVSAIRSTGKQALAELRRVVGVLRAPAADDTHPQPGISDVAALVSDVRAAGATVHVDWADDLHDLPPGMQLTIFRTVQEALTNARKHAAGAAVTVSMKRRADGLCVLVDDDGGPVGSTGEPGFGLVGLRERAALYGGVLSAGPKPTGAGWRVRLELPTRASSTPTAART